MQGMKCGAAAAGGGGESPVVLLFSQTLTANAASVSIDLSGVDMSQFSKLELVAGNIRWSGSSSGDLRGRFNGDTSASYVIQNGSSDLTYFTAGKATAKGGAGSTVCDIYDMGTKICSMCHGGYADSGSSISNQSGDRTMWKNGGIADLKSILIGSDSYIMAAGAKFVLYGYRM